MFHWIRGFTIDSPSNESLRLTQVAVVSVWRAQNYYFNKYLMKKVVLSIQTLRQMRMCSLGRLRAPAMNILCLQWRAAHRGGGGMNMEQVAFCAHTNTNCTVRARLQTCTRDTGGLTVVCSGFPQISWCLQSLPDRSGSSREGRSTRTRACSVHFCACVAALHQEKGTCAALQRLVQSTCSYYACWQHWESGGQGLLIKNRLFSIENVSFPLIVFPHSSGPVRFPFNTLLVLEFLVFLPFDQHWKTVNVWAEDKMLQRNSRSQSWFVKTAICYLLLCGLRTWALLRWCFWRTGAPEPPPQLPLNQPCAVSPDSMAAVSYSWEGENNQKPLVHFLI